MSMWYRNEVPAGTVLGKVEGVLQDSVDADSGHAGFRQTDSRSVPSKIRPPTLEYSPSVFSRTM
jgi:hypothetical protein